MELEFYLKIVIIGDSSVGKTNILSRYFFNNFEIFSKPTIGCDIHQKTIKKNNNTIHLNIYDTAGQERFKTLGPSFYNGAYGIILVFDLTNKNSFDNLNSWLNEIEENLNIEDIVILLVGNKKDLYEDRKINKEEIIKFSEKNKLIYFETSAKEENEINNIEKVFDKMIDIIFKNSKKLNSYKEKNKLKKDNINIYEEKKKCC